MTVRHSSRPFCWIFAAACALSLLSSFWPGLGAAISLAAETAPGSADLREIKVTLFGQPCSLRGPLDEAGLRAIHSISPEQAYPEFTTDATRYRAALDKLNQATGIPSALDQYKDKLARRLQAQTAFLDGLEEARKTGSMQALLAATKKYRQEHASKTFEKAALRIDPRSIGVSGKLEPIQQLFDSYNDLIEPDPEEEFHRAIRKIKVQYICTFEENEEGDSE